MKRLLALVLVLSCVMSMAGCADLLYTTSSYRTYVSFAQWHKAGMEKQRILDKLGCPDAYVDAQGTYHGISYGERESFEKNVAQDCSTQWVYDCYKRPDPADPYRLIITFGADGKSQRVELTLVPGG